MNELINRNEKVKTISSREVAKMMEVRHDNLMNKIEKHTAILQKVTDLKIKVSDLWQANSYKDSTGRSLKEYQVTKKGCEFLAHKTTGEKGDIFTIRYMDRFEEMEKIINSNDQLKSQLLLSIYNGGQDGILAAKQLTDLEVQEATKPLYREINHKEDVIVGLVEDIDLATKRQRIKQIINHNANGRFSERYGLLYKEFQDKYHIDIKRRMNNLELKSIITNKEGKDVKVTNKIKTNQMEYIDKILCMTPQLYEIACKVFENDVEELMKEWKNII